MKLIKLNLGIIKISMDIFYDLDYGIARKIFKKFIPFHIETDLAMDIITMKGRNSDFRKVDAGEILPTYNIEYDKKTKKIKFLEIK